MGYAQVVFPGDTYGRLTVLAELETRMNGARAFRCKCECGTVTDVSGRHLRTGHTRSCGCLHSEPGARGWGQRTHGLSRTPTYTSWQAMKSRCSRPTINGYENYGGRGIKVCDAWRDSFAAFLADMGPRPEGTTLDRIDVDGNYEPGNCRWATAEEQQANRRPGGKGPGLRRRCQTCHQFMPSDSEQPECERCGLY